MLAPVGLNVTNSNPLFTENAGSDYANKYFQYAISPLLDKQRTQNYLKGLGDPGTTLGGAYLGQLAAEGANSSFMAGEQYRRGLVEDLLNRRGVFDRGTAMAQNQDQLGIQRDLGVEDIRTSRLGQLNNFNLQSGSLLNNMYQNSLLGESARAANRSNALIGGLGLAGAALTTPLSRMIPGGSLLSKGIGGLSSLFNRRPVYGGGGFSGGYGLPGQQGT